MDRQRVQDRLVGAAVAVAALLLVMLVVLWSVSDPGDGGARPSPSASTGAGAGGLGGTGGGRPPEPPADLADDETWFGDLVLDAGTVVTAGSLLRDVQAVGQDVRAGPDGVVAGRLSVEATVPFDVIAEQLGENLTVRPAGDSQVRVERTVEIAGRELRVTATAAVEVERGRLVVEPRSVDVGGPAFLADAIGGLARRLVTIEHEVEGLPEGLVLRDVSVQDDGLLAELDGRDVRLTE